LRDKDAIVKKKLGTCCAERDMQELDDAEVQNSTFCYTQLVLVEFG